MLHIEQPYAGRGGDQGNGEVGCHCAGPRLPTVAHEADREAMLQEKQIGWSDPEHDQRVAVKSVFYAAPPRTGLVFAHCQGIDIADTAPVEVTGGGVMDRMCAAPPIVRRHREHANDTADPVVRQTVGEKGAMAAVVLDHEQAQEKSSSWNRDKQ